VSTTTHPAYPNILVPESSVRDQLYIIIILIPTRRNSQRVLQKGYILPFLIHSDNVLS